jgi:hypothetical protein
MRQFIGTKEEIMTITVFRARVIFLSIMALSLLATATMVIGGGFSHHREWLLLITACSTWILFELLRLFVLLVQQHPGDTDLNQLFGYGGLLIALGSAVRLMFEYLFTDSISKGYTVLFGAGMFIFLMMLFDLKYKQSES